MSEQTQPERRKQDPMGDEAAEAALEYLRFQAKSAGEAKAHVTYLENYVKIVLARCMRESTARAVSGQEVDARCHPDYLATVEALRDAVAKEEEFRWKRIAAEATLDAWRTKNANRRGEGRMQ